MIYHLIAFTAGFVLDLIIGDPYSIPHPVRFIGRLISFGEEKFLGAKGKGCGLKLTGKQKRFFGILEVLFVCTITEFFVILILMSAYFFNKALGCVVETIMTWQLLAAKCLKDEGMKVYAELERGSLKEARSAVSMIVGRDTENLNDEEITKAAVETIAENTSDGVIAPMLFLAVGGPVLGFFEKSINTMDSMIGYKNERYEDFGRCAAKLDDVVNYIPARISAFFMIFSCFFLGKEFNLKNAYLIYKRDRSKHQSPNAAHTESVCAGALGIRLAGPASYNGVIEEKPYLGDSLKEVEHKDIIKSIKLMYSTSVLCEFFSVFLMLIFRVY